MKKTSLNQIHKNQGGRMVEFAGYEMPIQYNEGIIAEHNWVRNGKIGLFDVSHMGQAKITGKRAAEYFSFVTPTNFNKCSHKQAKYTVLTNKNGGIIDDLIVTRLTDDEFFVVLNAACVEKDLNWLKKNLFNDLAINFFENRSLIAVQGKIAELILSPLLKDGHLSSLPYMHLGEFTLKNGASVYISRTGYTGEDGFEVSIENKYAGDFWLELCKNSDVKPIGLGARDSLRLEMGYPLYGHDLNDDISPIEAGLAWVVSNSDNFFGSDRILSEKNNGVSKKRFGIKLNDRGVLREGMEVKSSSGDILGKLTSGGFSPVLQHAIGQFYADVSKVKIGDNVLVNIRGRDVNAQITSFSFLKPKTVASKKVA